MTVNTSGPDTPDDATREHMREWAAGEMTHRGEAPPLNEPVDPHAVYRWPGGSGALPPGVYQEHMPAQSQTGTYTHRWGQPAPIVVQQNTGPFPPYAPYRPPVNHVLHLILTLLTCGLWAPVWITMAIIDAVRR